jgi:hypothetical protein
MARGARVLSVVDYGLQPAKFGLAEHAGEDVEDICGDSILEDDASHVNAVVAKEPFDAIHIFCLAGHVELLEMLPADIRDPAVGKPHAAQEHIGVMYRLHRQPEHHRSPGRLVKMDMKAQSGLDHLGVLLGKL